jgi:hypothetical protein
MQAALLQVVQPVVRLHLPLRHPQPCLELQLLLAVLVQLRTLVLKT